MLCVCVCSLYVVYSSYFYFFIFVAIFMRWTCYCYLFLTILLILTKLQCTDFCFINCDYKDVSDIFFINQLINFSHSNYSFTSIFSPSLPLTSPPCFYSFFFLFRKGQSSHLYQSAIAYQVAGRLAIFSPKAEQGNLTGGMGTKSK